MTDRRNREARQRARDRVRLTRNIIKELKHMHPRDVALVYFPDRADLVFRIWRTL